MCVHRVFGALAFDLPDGGRTRNHALMVDTNSLSVLFLDPSPTRRLPDAMMPIPWEGKSNSPPRRTPTKDIASLRRNKTDRCGRANYRRFKISILRTPGADSEVISNRMPLLVQLRRISLLVGQQFLQSRVYHGLIRSLHPRSQPPIQIGQLHVCHCGVTETNGQTS